MSEILVFVHVFWHQTTNKDMNKKKYKHNCTVNKARLMKETNSQVKDYRAPCYLNDSCTPPYLCRTFSVVNIELRPAFFSGA